MFSQQSPGLSKIVSSLAPSPTMALNTKAKAIAAKGLKVYNFSVGEPDYASPEVVVEAAIHALRKGRTKYGPAGGGAPLRQAIIKKLKRDNDLSYLPEQIVVGIGAKEILFHVFMAILNEGDEVIIPAPYWVSYTSQIECCKAKSVIIPMPEDSRSGPLSPECLDKYMTPKTKAVVLTSPNNPAGYVFKEQELRRLGEYLKDKNVWVVADEIYEYMAFDTPHRSLGTLCPEILDRFILVNGLSKAFAMTGWRVGYCAAPSKVAELVSNLQSHSSTCLPGFIEDAAAEALNQGPSLMTEQIELLKSRRALAVRELGRIPNIRVQPAEGAFYAYVDVRPALEKSGRFEANDSLGFSQYLLERYQVAMVPGEAFGTPGFLRLSYAVSETDIVDGIQRLGEGLSNHD